MNSARTRILFVDDETAILAGLRNPLRKETSRWDMVFAVGGQRALSEMRNAPADVVVTVYTELTHLAGNPSADMCRGSGPGELIAVVHAADALAEESSRMGQLE